MRKIIDYDENTMSITTYKNEITNTSVMRKPLKIMLPALQNINHSEVPISAKNSISIPATPIEEN